MICGGRGDARCVTRFCVAEGWCADARASASASHCDVVQRNNDGTARLFFSLCERGERPSRTKSAPVGWVGLGGRRHIEQQSLSSRHGERERAVVGTTRTHDMKFGHVFSTIIEATHPSVSDKVSRRSSLSLQPREPRVLASPPIFESLLRAHTRFSLCGSFYSKVLEGRYESPCNLTSTALFDPLFMLLASPRLRNVLRTHTRFPLRFFRLKALERGDS